MFPHTVTVYNKYKDGTAEKWQRTIIPGVYWNAIKGAVMRKTGVASADGLQLIIPFTAKAGYVAPKAWAEMTDHTGKWTLQSGDTVILGDIDYEVTRASSELKSFDNCIAITSVDIKDFGGGMAHWEVSGK